MNEKLISLIKDCRAESEKRWHPVTGYRTGRERDDSNAYDCCADALEELLRQLTSKFSRPAKEIDRLRDLSRKANRDHLRIGITVKREFSNSENDISDAAWQLHIKQKEKALKIKDKELGKLRMFGRTHTAKLAEGGRE